MNGYISGKGYLTIKRDILDLPELFVCHFTPFESTMGDNNNNINIDNGVFYDGNVNNTDDITQNIDKIR